MHDTYSPPLWAVMGCLANILVSVAMIWYLILFLSSCDACSARPFALAFIVGFLVILLLTGFRIVQTVICRQEEIPQDRLDGGKNYRDRWQGTIKSKRMPCSRFSLFLCPFSHKGREHRPDPGCTP